MCGCRIDVVPNIDLRSGYACDCVHMVLLLFHWWTTFFLSTLLVLLSMATRLGARRRQCCYSAHQFYFTSNSCAALFCKFLSSCFAWSKERFDHMVALVMLNSTRNRATWDGVKCQAQLCESSLCMCTSWVHLWCPHTGCARRPWVTSHVLEWQESNKNECSYENVIKKNEYRVPASSYAVPGIWFSSQRSYPQTGSLPWKMWT